MIVRYFFLQLKQTFKMLLRESVGLLAAFIVIGLGIVIISKATADEKTVSHLKVGVSVNEEDTVSKMAMEMVEDYDSVQSVCSFSQVDKDNIVPLMEKGELDAAIVIPDSFIEAADSGENIPATFYFSTEKQGKNIVFRELIMDALKYIQTAQGVVYSALNVANNRPEEAKMDYYSIGDFLAEKLFLQWGKKDNFFENRVVSAFGNFDYYSFYLLVALVMILAIALSRIGFLYDRLAKAMEQYLTHKGINGMALDGARCLVVYAVLLLYSGQYYLLLAILRIVGNWKKMDILKNMGYPVSFGTTMGICLFFTLLNHIIMMARQKVRSYFPKRVRYMLIFVLIMVVLSFVGRTVYRRIEVGKIGIAVDSECNNARNLLDELKQADTQLELIIYENKSQLEADVAKEVVDSGFYITEDTNGRILVQGMSGLFSFAYLVAEETIYTQIYSDECRNILLEEADKIYKNSSSIKLDLDRELQRQRLEKDTLQLQLVEVQPRVEKTGKNKDGNTHKMMAILVGALLILLLQNEYERVFSTEGKAITLVLRGKRVFVIKPMVAISGLMAVAFIGNIIISGIGDIRTLLLFPPAIIYIYLMGLLFSDRRCYRQLKGIQLLVWLVIVVFIG